MAAAGTEKRRMLKRIAAALLIAASLSSCQAPTPKTPDQGMQGAARALDALGPVPQGALPATQDSAVAAGAEPAPARAVLARIDRYADGARSGTPAIDAWFALYDDYRQLARLQAEAVQDPRTGQPLSMLSLMAVLPGPGDWPAMRETARRRAARAAGAEARSDALALVLLFDALLYDVPAQAQSLDHLRDAVAKASAQRRQHTLALTDEWHRYLEHDAGRTGPSAHAAPDVRPPAACCAEAARAEAPPDADVAALATRLQRQLSPAGETPPAKSAGAASLLQAAPALQLAQLGLLEQRDDWLRDGLSAARDALAATRAAAYGATHANDGSARAGVLTDTVYMLRAAGMNAAAEKLLFEELAAIGATCRALGAGQCHDRFADPAAGRDDELAARLLLALYAGTGRDADVRILADRYPLWGHDDAALLFVDRGPTDGDQPALAIARALVAGGETQRAANLLQALASQSNRSSPQVATLYGQVAKDDAIGATLLMRQHALGPRNAMAALAGAAAGLWPRAEELALAARREQLYAPWRAAMDDVLAGAATARGDASAAARWHDAAQAQALAARALRYRKAGAAAQASAGFAAALEKAQPGDCIENLALDAARARHDTALAATLLQRLARNAQQDASGGAIGCLKGHLGLTAEEFAQLRAALNAPAAAAVPQFAIELPNLVSLLGADCNLSARADPGRACVAPEQRERDARAAYTSIKDHLLPFDIDGVETLDAMVRRSAFPSLYAGSDSAPAPPPVEVSAYERDDWPLRLAKFDPSTLPNGIERRHAMWSPVVHLSDYWSFAFGAFSRQAPAEPSAAAYPLAAANAYAASTSPGAAPRAPYLAPRDPSLRANLVVASTEIVMTAMRLLEPDRHEPCARCR